MRTTISLGTIAATGSRCGALQHAGQLHLQVLDLGAAFGDLTRRRQRASAPCSSWRPLVGAIVIAATTGGQFRGRRFWRHVGNAAESRLIAKSIQTGGKRCHGLIISVQKCNSTKGCKRNVMSSWLTR